MQIVLDTNVIVSGMLSADSKPGTILSLVLEGEIQLCMDDRILAEYGRVLRRPKFGFAKTQIEGVLAYVAATSAFVHASDTQFQLPDMDDLPFLQVAEGGAADYLVTGNARHFPAGRCGSVVVVSPAEFLEAYTIDRRS